jgi:ribosomal protein S6--L-glutamate ligase
MRFCLLTRFHANHGQSTFARRLIDEAAGLGHSFELVNPVEITVQYNKLDAMVQWQGKPFPPFDLVHYALRWDDDHTWGIVDTLRGIGFTVIPPHRIPMGDSITMARLFARNNISTPRTWVFSSAQQLSIVLGEIPFPCLFRVRRGSQGRRVFIAEHTGEAMQLAETLSANGYPFMVQEILAPTGMDIRAFVVGAKVVAAIERVAPPGYIWPREDGNARATGVTLTPAEEALVLAATKVYNAPSSGARASRPRCWNFPARRRWARWNASPAPTWGKPSWNTAPGWRNRRRDLNNPYSSFT